MPVWVWRAMVEGRASAVYEKRRRVFRMEFKGQSVSLPISLFEVHIE